METHPTIPYRPYDPGCPAEEAARRFFEQMRSRRSVREFASTPVSRQVVEDLVRAAGSAPSGANKQPWRFVCVGNPALKRRIREAAEEEERAFYERRAPESWLDDLAPLGTDWQKPFLETAPWLIVVFQLTKLDDGSKAYYVQESVGIAVGMLLAAVHQAGLVALTHTPSPMGFLREVLGRPEHERPFMLIPIGYPAETCRVPAITRKALDEICTFEESAASNV